MKTCILAIQRYERIEDLKELIRYHIDNVHIDHIFLLDNNDRKDALKIEDPNLTILPCYDITINTGDSTWQCNAYNYGLEYIKLLDYQWIAIIDADEFITLRNHNNIQDFIQEECIDKGYSNVELKWELYNDSDILYYDPKYAGNVLTTYKEHHSVDSSNNWNFFSFVSMRHFLKFIGKITPELRYDDSPHYPMKKLYDEMIYRKHICSENVAVLRHYKYKCLEDFISLKAKLRSYTKSVHGSVYKYTRTYFEDNNIFPEKLFAFAMLAFKHGLEMTEWDISYLHTLLKYSTRSNINIFYISLNKSLHKKFNINDVNIFEFNEDNLDLNICPYIRFMYDYGYYDICIDFFKKLLLYYFGGSYLDYDENIYESNKVMYKPFNNSFLEFINNCKSLTYDQLYKMHNEMNKNEFINIFKD